MSLPPSSLALSLPPSLLGLSMQPRLAWNLQSSCLSLPSAGFGGCVLLGAHGHLALCVACMVLCTWRTCAAVIGRLCAVMGDGGGAQAGAQARGACCQRPFTDQQDGRCNPQHQENNPTKSKKNMTWKALRTPRA
jgi:hypothetical protein